MTESEFRDFETGELLGEDSDAVPYPGIEHEPEEPTEINDEEEVEDGDEA